MVLLHTSDSFFQKQLIVGTLIARLLPSQEGRVVLLAVLEQLQDVFTTSSDSPSIFSSSFSSSNKNSLPWPKPSSKTVVNKSPCGTSPVR
ncbi:unnamed protein product [Caenorhabditis auriculariae]|uniref:Uncharacterized protein n=1 Tax=Caenorhabditis auriculariae TaxID=2777116 RepID=A0A8S1HUV6_9PELO|nr:unnamed protein product [Caenorhabditis auriculariae]